MLTDALTSTSSTVQDDAAATNGSANSQNDNSLQNRFLTMLTAELKNQDPTNPMSSTEMVSQLSQLSESQGINNLNKLSQTQILALLGTQRLASSQLIGKTVDYKSDHLSVKKSDDTFSGSVDPSEVTGDSVTFNVTDKAGNILQTIKATKGADGRCDWQWDGTDQHGHHLESGDYKITSSTGKPMHVILKGQVHTVNFESNGSTQLVFADQRETSIQNILSIADK